MTRLRQEAADQVAAARADAEQAIDNGVPDSPKSGGYG